MESARGTCDAEIQRQREASAAHVISLTIIANLLVN